MQVREPDAGDLRQNRHGFCGNFMAVTAVPLRFIAVEIRIQSPRTGRAEAVAELSLRMISYITFYFVPVALVVSYLFAGCTDG